MPELRTLPPGSTIRFRIYDAARRLESSTWSIVGSKKTGDLYFSRRQIMSDLKISLHQSGVNRMAWTQPAARSRLAQSEDRAVTRWSGTEPLPAGWAMGLRLVVLDSALSPALVPLPSPRFRPAIVLPAPGSGKQVIVTVLVGRPGSGDLTLEGELEEVARMTLGDGTMVWVTAWKHDSNDAVEQQLYSIRQNAIDNGAAVRPHPRVFGWGSDDASGTPIVMDAGDPRPTTDIPLTYGRYDGPADVVVRELRPDG